MTVWPAPSVVALPALLTQPLRLRAPVPGGDPRDARVRDALRRRAA